MSFEYHGWIALASSQKDWSDGDFERAFAGVAQVLDSLRPDKGHEALLPDCAVLPRVLYLKGSQVESLEHVFKVIEEVCALFDGAYGELAVLGEVDRPAAREPSQVTRHIIANGALHVPGSNP
jgi:hypothetical protein